MTEKEVEIAHKVYDKELRNVEECIANAFTEEEAAYFEKYKQDLLASSVELLLQYDSQKAKEVE